MQRRITRVIGDKEAITPELLQLRRDDALLTAFYRNYRGEFLEELFYVIPPTSISAQKSRDGHCRHRVLWRSKRFDVTIPHRIVDKRSTVSFSARIPILY